MIDLGNGYYRCYAVITALNTLSSAVAQTRICKNFQLGNNQYTGDGTSGVYVWGQQFEEGTEPTSYIPTNSTAMTRAADNLGRLLGDEYRQSRGTVWLDFDITPPGLDSGSLNVLRLFDGVAAAIDLRYINSVSQFDVLVRNNGVTTIDSQQRAYVEGVNSAAFSWDESGVYFSANGSAAIYDSGTVPTTLTNLLILEDVSGHLRSLLFIPTTLPEKLQELTSA